MREDALLPTADLGETAYDLVLVSMLVHPGRPGPRPGGACAVRDTFR